MQVDKTGITRTVVLTKTLAIKIPCLRYGWSIFLTGILCNLNERLWWNITHDERLCPVIFSEPIGLLLVMKRCPDVDHLPPKEDFDCLPLDYKIDNFGYLNGKVVLRDYGS